MASGFEKRQGYAEGEVGDDYGYQKALRKQTRKELRATPGILDNASRELGRQTERQGAQVMAQSGSCDLGALTDVGNQFRQNAASQMWSRAMDVQQSKIDSLGAEAAMDSPQQRADKAMQAAQDRIDVLIEQAGVGGEQIDVANGIAEMLKTERDPGTRRYLESRQAEIRKAGGFWAQTGNLFGANIGEDV